MKPRLINHPNLSKIIEELTDMNISTYDLFQVIKALGEDKIILSMLLDEIPSDEKSN